MEYRINRAASPVTLPSDWDSPFWSAAPALDINHFHPQSATTAPRAQAKILYDPTHLYLHFRVHEEDVRATFTEYQSPVCQDSCAEFFVQPRPDKGYFNFELNPLGTLLLFYVTDPTRVGPSLAKFEQVPSSLASTVKIFPSLTRPPTSGAALLWTLQYAVPFTLFEPYVGNVTPKPNDSWRANLYKCGDKTPHPHWASWSPIGDQLNFHQPPTFGTLLFAP